MGRHSRQEISEQAAERRNRILAYMTQDPPLPLPTIIKMEGMHDRSCRVIVKELDAEHELGYMANQLRRPYKDDMPHGLTTATSRFRMKLGNYVYMLRERGSDADSLSRGEVASKIGLNNRQQLRAENRPFNHDWTLSQIERLAREHGENPMEFMLKCLTT